MRNETKADEERDSQLIGFGKILARLHDLIKIVLKPMYKKLHKLKAKHL